MDTKALDHCIEVLTDVISREHPFWVRGEREDDVLRTALSLAIQVKEGQLVEPMSEYELLKIVRDLQGKGNLRDIYDCEFEDLAKALIGKLSTHLLKGSFVIWKNGNWKYIPHNAWEYRGDPDFLLDIDLENPRTFEVLP
jgi:hypothetical protein